MDLKKCDRCLQIFEPGQSESGSIAAQIHSAFSSWVKNKVYDFCPECMKAIEKLLLAELN